MSDKNEGEVIWWVAVGVAIGGASAIAVSGLVVPEAILDFAYAALRDRPGEIGGAALLAAAALLLLGTNGGVTRRWRALLGHPAIITIGALAPIGLAIWGGIVAKEAFDDQKRLSSYQLLASDTASARVKWVAAIAVLQIDSEVAGPTISCEPADNSCDMHTGLDIVGPAQDDLQPDHYWSFISATANGQFFNEGEWRSLLFRDAQMQNMRLQDVEVTRVVFQNSNLDGLVIDDSIIESAPPMTTDLTIWKSSMRAGRINLRNYADLWIEESDVSDATFTGDLASFTGNVSNYYFVGHPPKDASGPRPDLAAFECTPPVLGRDGKMSEQKCVAATAR